MFPVLVRLLCRLGDLNSALVCQDPVPLFPSPFSTTHLPGKALLREVKWGSSPALGTLCWTRELSLGKMWAMTLGPRPSTRASFNLKNPNMSLPSRSASPLLLRSPRSPISPQHTVGQAQQPPFQQLSTFLGVIGVSPCRATSGK